MTPRWREIVATPTGHVPNSSPVDRDTEVSILLNRFARWAPWSTVSGTSFGSGEVVLLQRQNVLLLCTCRLV